MIFFKISKKNSYSFKEENWATLQKLYAKDRVALTFLSNFEADDVAAIILGPNSTALWIISPPDLDRLREDLINSKFFFS